MKSRGARMILLCLDGCSWQYLNRACMPNLAEMKDHGSSVSCRSMMPTVTNVNNASILTGRFPSEHGITGNYFFDASKNSEVYMDSWQFLNCETVLENASKRGSKTLFLTVKDKLLRLLGRGVHTSFSLEKPSSWILKRQGKPPGVYSLSSGAWLMDAALHMLEKECFEIAYISTTDYVQHTYGPESTEAKEYMQQIDSRIGVLLESDSIIGVTADHGMNKKTLKVDLRGILTDSGIKTRIVQTIKDEYVRHHKNLGGSAYVYLEGDRSRAKTIISDTEGVEAVFTREEAVELWKLPPNRIGDLFVVGTESAVFGDVQKGFHEDISLRSHGSLHESEVPFLTNRKVRLEKEFLSKDAFGVLFGEHG